MAAPAALPAHRDRRVPWHLIDDGRPRSSSGWSFPPPLERRFTCHPPPQARLSVVSVGRRSLRSCLPKQASCSSGSCRSLGASTSALSTPQTRATTLTSKPDQLSFPFITPQLQQSPQADAAGSAPPPRASIALSLTPEVALIPGICACCCGKAARQFGAMACPARPSASLPWFVMWQLNRLSKKGLPANRELWAVLPGGRAGSSTGPTVLPIGARPGGP